MAHWPGWQSIHWDVLEYDFVYPKEVFTRKGVYIWTYSWNCYFFAVYVYTLTVNDL